MALVRYLYRDDEESRNEAESLQIKLTKDGNVLLREMVEPCSQGKEVFANVFTDNTKPNGCMSPSTFSVQANT